MNLNPQIELNENIEVEVGNHHYIIKFKADLTFKQTETGAFWVGDLLEEVWMSSDIK